MAERQELSYRDSIQDLGFGPDGISYAFANTSQPSDSLELGEVPLPEDLPVVDKTLTIVERISEYGDKTKPLRIALPKHEVLDGDVIIAQSPQPEDVKDEPAITSEATRTEQTARSDEVIYATGSRSAQHISFNGLRRILSAAKAMPSELTIRAAVKAKTLGGNIAGKAQSLEHRPNKKVVGLALGGLALATAIGVAYVESKGFGLSHSAHSHDALQQVIPTKAPHPATEAIVTPAKAPTHHVQTIHHSLRHQPPHRIEKLNKPGDTIYSHVHQRVLAKYPGLSQAKVNQLTDKFSSLTVKLNHFSNWRVHHMAVGQKFKDLSWLS